MSAAIAEGVFIRLVSKRINVYIPGCVCVIHCACSTMLRLAVCSANATLHWHVAKRRGRQQRKVRGQKIINAARVSWQEGTDLLLINTAWTNYWLLLWSNGT